MKLDLDRPTKNQLQILISNINNVFDEHRHRDNLPKFTQFRLVHSEKRTYLIRAELYDSKTFKILKTKELVKGSIGNLTYFIFNSFYKARESA